MKKLLPVLFFLMLCMNVKAQFQFSGEVNLQGQYGSGDELPFWMYHNKRGRVSENTNVAGWITGKLDYELNYFSFLEFGAGILYQDGSNDEIFLDEIFAAYKRESLEILIGRKQQEELYNGLSSSNKNILWSLNPRPIPGIQIRTRKPVFFSRTSTLGFEGSWNEYFLEADRHVNAAKLHHKRLLLVLKPNKRWTFKGAGQHFVQWGGTSETRGDQPETFDDYIKNITGQTAVSGGSGQHLGGYEAHVKRSFRNFSLEFFYNYPFESTTGFLLRNIPDGRYGLFYETRDKDQIVNSVIYEFTYTLNQGVNFGFREEDYFNNGIYRSGWTYENRVLGSPFFTESSTGEGIENNRFIAHHIGLGGRFSNYFVSYPYKLMLSYSSNRGRQINPYNPLQDMIALYTEFGLLRNLVDLDLQFAAEFSSNAAPLFGIGIQVKKRF